MIYVTAVMNYAAQSEMLVYLLKSVSGLVEQKGYNNVDEAIKVMFLVRTVETLLLSRHQWDRRKCPY